MSYQIQLKRVYEEAEKEDGRRVLGDRLWPRGKKRCEMALDDWCNALAPSHALRTSWHRREIDYQTFGERYRQEPQNDPYALSLLMSQARQGRLTLLTASRDIDDSHLPILRRVLLDALEEEDREADGREPSSPVCYRALFPSQDG